MTPYNRCVEEAARAIGIVRAGPMGIFPASAAKEMPLEHFMEPEKLCAEAEAALSAILTVLREPDSVMVDAGAEMCEDAYSGKAATAVWQAMLGTIKAES